MLLRLPTNLHYPITINKIEARVGDNVTSDDNLFLYSYVTKVTQGSRDGEEVEVDKKFVVHFKSTLEGSIESWRVWEGDVIEQPLDVCEVVEECSHAVQYLGMCTNCGKDMTAVQPGSTQDTERAKIQPLHDTQYLTISEEEANKIDEEAKRRLLTSRKLSLVVDLDQTIIHAAVDPTIAEWQKDKDNPNHDAVKDVRAFQLVDEGSINRATWYYIKLRPGLEEFLENISHIYELHIYTMGTRQYALQIANIVDPDRRYFGDRILSRDESGSHVAKNLERLFPVDTKMVVIIDDRGDVWKWSANLVRVTPFDFFVGIGDINSTFLPKKQEIQATPEAKRDKTPPLPSEDKNGDHKTNGVAEDGVSTIQDGTSALEQLVSMSGSDDPVIRELQSKGQEELISSQLEDKPLSKMQQMQDEKDEAEAASEPEANGEQPNTQASTDSDSSESTTSLERTPTRSKSRHSILKNDDEELIHLEARLTAVHTRFYNEYDRRRLSGKGGRVAALTGKRKAPLPEDDTDQTDLQLVPDVKKVMPDMKMRVLAGVVIVFSGVLPLGTDIQSADISIWAKTFGAKITDKVSRDTTHVIAARIGTQKVKAAIKRGIKVVSTSWLIASIQQWRKLDERPYLLDGAGQKGVPDREPGSSEYGEDLLEKTNLTARDFLLSSSEGETTSFGDTDDDFNLDTGGQPPRKKLRLNVPTIEVGSADVDGDNKNNGHDEDFVDDGSPIEIDQDDWADMDEELREFMGSEAETESEAESVSSRSSKKEKKRSLKRRRDDDDDEDNRSEDNQGSGSGSSKSPRKAGSGGGGGSALKMVANVDSEHSTPVSADAVVASNGVEGVSKNDQKVLSPITNESAISRERKRDDVDFDDDRADTIMEGGVVDGNGGSDGGGGGDDNDSDEDDDDDEMVKEFERELQAAADDDDEDDDGEGGEEE